MKGSEIIYKCPFGQVNGRQYQLLTLAQPIFLEAARTGSYLPIDWSAIRCEYQGHLGILFVSSDVLTLGEPDDFFRANVSAVTAQKIADTLGLRLPTPKICDLIHQNSVVKVEPCTRDVEGHTIDMMTVPWMVDHSVCVGQKIGAQPGLASSLGKDWVLCKHLEINPSSAVNYGWYSARAPRHPDYISVTGHMPLWQPLGSKHNHDHVDYSQTLRLVQPTIIVDGVTMLLDDVLRSIELAPMVSHEGALSVVRQPGVPMAPPTDPPPTLRDPSAVLMPFIVDNLVDAINNAGKRP